MITDKKKCEHTDGGYYKENGREIHWLQRWCQLEEQHIGTHEMKLEREDNETQRK